jgi:predicted nucleotidyltransferase
MQPFIAEKREQFAELCRKHHVKRLAIFGSAVRDDFDPERSDVDFLFSFDPELPENYLGRYLALEQDLEGLIKLKVDLIRDGVIRNRFRLEAIDHDKVELYAT